MKAGNFNHEEMSLDSFKIASAFKKEHHQAYLCCPPVNVISIHCYC